MSPLSDALCTALRHLRDELGETASIAVLTPDTTSGELARQTLERATALLRVRFIDPRTLLSELALPDLYTGERQPQPPGWAEATLTAWLAAEPPLGELGATLAEPGWSGPLARACGQLEEAGVDAGALAAVSDSPRRALFAAALAHLAAARLADGLHPPARTAAAALAALERAEGPLAAVQGVVVLGDRTLSPPVSQVVRRYLSQRVVVRVVAPGWAHLAAAPLGLTEACEDCEAIVSDGVSGGLGQLQAQLFAPGSPVDTDASVQLQRAPDESRELREVVRGVLAAVEEGVSLDEIAIVLPDDTGITELATWLGRAGLPTTRMLGPSLESTAPAGFLAMALEVAMGQDDSAAWWRLLTLPGLSLQAAGLPRTTGRGRWRRMIQRLGPVADTARLLTALGEVELDPEAEPAEVAALDALRLTVGALGAALVPLAEPGTLGAHAAAWRSLVLDWWRPSLERNQLADALGAFADVGPQLSALAAWREVSRLLQGRSVLEGQLTDRSVRVLYPMGALGGSFRRVFAVGLVEGRLPVTTREDPLLSDAFVVEVREATGASLLTSRERARGERRRLAAVVGAATERLVLTWPGQELRTGKPTLPSSLLLTLASTLVGERVGFARLRTLATEVGSRARPLPAEPDQALTVAERRAALARKDPSAALQALVAHPDSRRLVERARFRAHREPHPHTGLVPPEEVVVPGLDGEPLSARALAELLSSPERFFIHRILGAWRARTPRPPREVDDPYTVRTWLTDVLRGEVTEELAEAFTSAVAERRRHAPLDAGEEAVMAQLAAPMLRVAGAHAPDGPLAVAGTVGAFTLEDDSAQREGDGVTEWTLGTPGSRKGFATHHPALVLVAMAAALPDATRLAVRRVDGKATTTTLAETRPELEAALTDALARVQAGFWPTEES